MNDETKPNVLWITLDSIRADHTSFTSYHRDTTPCLRQFAENRGTYFQNCFAVAHSSRPSVSSMFSGVYPTRHGNGFHNRVIPSKLMTIAERFLHAGYLTNCIVANPHVTPETNADKGFIRFEWITKRRLTKLSNFKLTLKYLANLRRHSVGYTADPKLHSSDYLVQERVKHQLRKLASKDSPFYLYAHYMAAHRPYYPPLPYQDRYLPEVNLSRSEALKASLRISDNIYESMASGLDFSQDEMEAVIALYDAEIAYIDALIGSLLSYIDDLPIGDTIVIITADHGELLGEQELLGHGLRLNDALLHVPLLILGWGEDMHPDELIQHIDIMKTILEIVGANSTQLHGIDLRSTSREYIFAQRAQSSFQDNLQRIREYNPTFSHPNLLPGRVNCIRSRVFKLLENGERATLYRISREAEDVSGTYPDVVKTLQQELGQFKDYIGDDIHATLDETITPTRKKQLKNLGYLG